MPAIALVAAGARLGLSLAKIFGGHGFDVALIARSKDRLGELTGKLAAEGITAAGFPADVTDRPALTAALDSAAGRFGPINVLHYSSPGAGTIETLRSTGPLDVTVDNLQPQIESTCYGAITATRAVLPAMLAAGTGTLLYTTGASSVTPAPVFVSAGMAGAALRKWALTLNGALAGQGVYASHVAIGTWIAGSPGAPDGTPLNDPDDIARLYWDLHTAREPTVCPCAADMPGAENMPVPGFRNDRRWGFSNERLGIMFHGNTVTHLDSPCHIFWDGMMYNGRPHALVGAATGSGWAAVTAAANGILTRGVLLDIARVRDVPWLEPGQGVFPSDLEEAERRQGVRVRSGDAVLLRTGYGRVRHQGGAATGFTQAGWHASCLPWLHERQVALIGADTPQDVQPSGYEDMLMPVHAVSLVAMGLWLLDNCDLEVCARTAAELGQWDFHLAVAPVRFAGTSGSPVNPIATF